MLPSHQSSTIPWNSGISSSACFSRFTSFFMICPMFSFCSFSWDTWICSSSGGYQGEGASGSPSQGCHLQGLILAFPSSTQGPTSLCHTQNLATSASPFPPGLSLPFWSPSMLARSFSISCSEICPQCLPGSPVCTPPTPQLC